MISIGAQLSVGGAGVEQIVDTAVAYEEAGIESVWVGDHLLDYYDPRRTTPECFTTLAAIARATNTVRMGSLVAGVFFRHPMLLAKIAASLTELSTGRFELGLGTGGVKSEHVALGFDFPSRSERLRRLKTTLRILTQLRDGGPVKLTPGNDDEAWCSPPLGDTPLLVGAMHPGVAATAGRYADDVNAIDYADGPDVVGLFEAASAAAEKAGREIRWSVLVPARDEPLYGGRHPRSGVDRAQRLGVSRMIYRLLPPYPRAEHVLAGEA